MTLRAFAVLTGYQSQYTRFRRSGLHFFDERPVFFDKRPFFNGERPAFIVKWIKCLAVTLLLTLAATSGYAQLPTTVIVETSKNWSDITPQPTSLDEVIVTNEATLTVDTSNAEANTLRLGCHNNCANPVRGYGTLIFDSSPNSQLTVSNAVIFGTQGVGRDGFLDMSNGGTLIAGVWTFNEGDFTPGTGLVEFTGNTTHPAILDTFYDIEISSGIAQTFTLSAALTVLNDLTLDGGTLNADNHNVTLQGNWVNNGGTYQPGTNTTFFTGGQEQDIIGGGTFYDLVLDNTAGDVYLKNDAITVNNALTLTNGRLILGAQDLNMAAETVINGGSDSAYISADDGGLLRRFLNLNDIDSTFNFEVGDSLYYSPMNFTLNDANLGVNPSITVAVFGEAHPEINPGPNSHYINRYWDLNAENVLSIGYVMDYFYVDDDVVGTEEAMWSARWDGSVWESYDTVDAASNRLSIGTELTTLGASDAFTGGDEGSALPVELTFFRAEVEDNKVILEWATATERHSDYFEVQRAVGDDNFETLHRVHAAGHATTTRDYRVADADPPAGKLYYRLRQVDTDGTDAYFAPVSVHISATAQDWSVYPNPVTATGSITLQHVPENLYEVEILDVTGRSIWRTAIRQPSAQLELSLPEACDAGMYFLRLHTPNGPQHKRLLVR